MNANPNQNEILLVDDDPDYLDLAKIRLETSGYQVSCVSDGTQALKLLDTDYRPKLIILDIEMPNKNGLTTLINLNLKQTRDEKKGMNRIPVIIATGLQSDVVRELMLSHQVADYLKKPYSAEELINKVKASIHLSTGKGNS